MHTKKAFTLKQADAYFKMNAFAHYEVIVHPEKNIVKKNTNFFEKGLTEKKDGFRMRGVKAKAS